MRQDPKARRSAEGFALDEEDKQALKSVDWSGSDEELQGTGEQVWHCDGARVAAMS